MRERNRQMTKEQMDAHRFELENRVKNLFWTVSGDYTSKISPDMEVFAQSKDVVLYDATRQGAFTRFFDAKAWNLYLMKKIHLGAQEEAVLDLSELCMGAAVYQKICLVRPGIEEIRKKAFADMLRLNDGILEKTIFGQVKLAMIEQEIAEDSGREEASSKGKAALTADSGQKEEAKGSSQETETADSPSQRPQVSSDVTNILAELSALSGAETTEEIIAVFDHLYNQYFDTDFEKKHGNLEEVLRLSPYEVVEHLPQTIDEEQIDEVLEAYLIQKRQRRMRKSMRKALRKASDYENNTVDSDEPFDEAAAEKIENYVLQTFGQSFYTPTQRLHRNERLCQGIHKNCLLYDTDGIMHSYREKNNQYLFESMQTEKNRLFYYNKHWMVKRNVANLADTLRKSLILRMEEEVSRFTSGQIVPSRLWKVRRTDDKKLFDKKELKESSRFVVDIMLDASGSQALRQSRVAIQGYIISEALSEVGIAHRVTAYSTFWNYTILHRFRDYDDDREKNQRIFEFRAMANNRDGLAVRAISDSLGRREEEKKILIVLSDGKPHDIVSARKGMRRPSDYTGEEAIRDTAFEVRRARQRDIAVFGIFAGDEEDLPAEKRIFGKDFAYIRDISNFSKIVGTFLRQKIEED